MKGLIIFLLLMGCASTPPKNPFNPDGIEWKYYSRTKDGVKLRFLVYETQKMMNDQYNNLPGKKTWGSGDGKRCSNLRENIGRSVGQSLFKPGCDERRTGFYYEAINSINIVKGDGRYSCEHQFQHALESKKWNNKVFTINEVCP